MEKLLKDYSSFFLIQMDEESLESFSLPNVLEPARNQSSFS